MLLLENLDENVKKTSTLTLEEVVSKKTWKNSIFYSLSSDHFKIKSSHFDIYLELF